MKNKFSGLVLKAAAAIMLLGGLSQQADAAAVFVGSWQVDAGPSWFGTPPNGPLAYTAQEAAALLFGGVASDYAISTVDSSVANINNMGWYSVIGYGGNQGNGGSILAENYSSKYLGQYYGPTSGYTFGNPNEAASAYVRDNATGAQFTNYAFRLTADAVPEPGSMVLFALGAVGYGVVSVRRRRSNA